MRNLSKTSVSYSIAPTYYFFQGSDKKIVWASIELNTCIFIYRMLFVTYLKLD